MRHTILVLLLLILITAVLLNLGHYISRHMYRRGFTDGSRMGIITTKESLACPGDACTKEVIDKYYEVYYMVIVFRHHFTIAFSVFRA